jgi:Icc-related predicted phosphoesterase
MKKIKIAHISDTHGKYFIIPKCDLFIHSGDYGNIYCNESDNRFKENILKYNDCYKVAYSIRGNHDAPAGEKFKIGKPRKFKKFLINYYQSVSPINGRWGFEEYLPDRKDKLNKILYCDILISHSPPTGLKDRVYDKNGCCEALESWIIKHQPKYVFCGHIHELCGEYKIGETNVIVSFNKMRIFDITITN